MISSFHIRNFKSYRDAMLPIAPLTLLIGANASGKSNALEAIRLLSMVAAGRRVDEIVSEIQSSDELIRGNARDLPRDRHLPVTLGCDLDQGESNSLELALVLAESDPKLGELSRMGDEVVGRRGVPHLYRASRDPAVVGERTMHIRGDVPAEEAHLLVTDRTAVFPFLDSLLSPSTSQLFPRPPRRR